MDSIFSPANRPCKNADLIVTQPSRMRPNPVGTAPAGRRRPVCGHHLISQHRSSNVIVGASL
jgi:hypothetical protein